MYHITFIILKFHNNYKICFIYLFIHVFMCMHVFLDELKKNSFCSVGRIVCKFIYRFHWHFQTLKFKYKCSVRSLLHLDKKR